MKQTNIETYNMDQVREAAEYLRKLTLTDEQSKKMRMEFIRALAYMARKNPKARYVIESKLAFVERFLPYESETFRSFFLDGTKRKSARIVSKELCMDPSTVFNHIKKVLECMLVVVFGSDAIFTISGEDHEKMREESQ